jgi:hypothetical protein
MSKSIGKKKQTETTGVFNRLTNGQRIVGGIVVIMLVIAVIIAANSSRNQGDDGIAVEQVLVDSRSHDDDADHHNEEGEDILPPTGGVHSTVWLNCGVYDEPVDVGPALHSLEHGAVWIVYHPDLPESEVGKLRDIVAGSDHRILSPYPDLASPIVATSWGYRLRLEEMDEDSLNQFIHDYENGKNAPEPGASCSSGTGNPIG